MKVQIWVYNSRGIAIKSIYTVLDNIENLIKFLEQFPGNYTFQIMNGDNSRARGNKNE